MQGKVVHKFFLSHIKRRFCVSRNVNLIMFEAYMVSCSLFIFKFGKIQVKQVMIYKTNFLCQMNIDVFQYCN